MVIESFKKRVIVRAYKLTNYGMLVIHGVWAIPMIIVIRLIRPWRTVRFGTIRSDRIGHFAEDAGQQWAMMHLKEKKFVDLYWLPEKTCNSYFAELVSRHLSIHWWVRPLDYWNRYILGGDDHCRASTDTKSRDIHGYLEKANKKFLFLPSEDERGKKWLRKYGWRDGEKFVCLLVRDEAYLAHTLKQSEGYWKYHAYRDTNIADYELATLWLAEQGIWVLRMGKIMKEPLKTIHPKIIDYAFGIDKSDFLDVWLFANCYFCISTGSGPDSISDIFRRPMLLLNYLPLRDMYSWSNATHLPRPLFWKATGNQLSLSEYLTNAYFKNDDYHRAGIIIKNLPSEVIRKAVQEMIFRLQGVWRDREEDLKMHQLFWKLLRKCPDYHKIHGYIHPEAKVGTVWFRTISQKCLN